MKTRKITAILLAAMLALFAVPFGVSAAEGTAISDAGELISLMSDSSKWSGTYYLAADIDLTGRSGQAPIGNAETPFTGVFDGNGKTISGLDLSGSKYQALFGKAENVTIKNLTVKGEVEETSTSGTEVYAAGIVGSLRGTSTLENVTSYVNVSALGVASAQAVGGLAGKAGCIADNDVLTIKNCHAYGKIEAGRGVGSLIGILSAGGVEETKTPLANTKITVEGCSGNGEVIYYSGSSAGQAGGFIGNIFTYVAHGFEVTVSDCVNNASLTGVAPKTRVGGVVGWMDSNVKTSLDNPAGGTVNIINCKNTAEIVGSSYVGGIIGYVTFQYRSDFAVNIKGCVNEGIVSGGADYVGGILGGTKGGVYLFEQCANLGSVEATGQHAGGIMGHAIKASSTAGMNFTFNDCANYGTVTAFAGAAGIFAFSDSDVVANRCFNGGKLVVTDFVGVKCGFSAAPNGLNTVNDCYFLDSEMDLLATAVSSTDAAKAETFKNFDFANVWVIENSVPTLRTVAKGTGDDTPVTTGNAVTEAPTTDAVTTTDAPTTTDASQSTTAADTGDETLVILAMAVMAAAIAVVTVKKKARV